MNRIVIIGAGQTGRGFINRLLYLNHVDVVFLDINHELVNRLNREKQYKISFIKGEFLSIHILLLLNVIQRTSFHAQVFVD